MFSPLTKAQVRAIIDIALVQVRGHLAEKDIRLDLTEAAKDAIADEAYSPQYGARPLKRYIQKYIETELAAKIVRGEVLEGQLVTLDAENGKLLFR